MDCIDVETSILGFWVQGRTMAQLRNMTTTLPFCDSIVDCYEYYNIVSRPNESPESFPPPQYNVHFVCIAGYELSMSIPKDLQMDSNNTLIYKVPSSDGCEKEMPLRGICTCNGFQGLAGPNCEPTGSGYLIQRGILVVSCILSIVLFLHACKLLTVVRSLTAKRKLCAYLAIIALLGFLYGHIYHFVEAWSPKTREVHYEALHAIEASSSLMMGFGFTFNNFFTAGHLIETVVNTWDNGKHTKSQCEKFKKIRGLLMNAKVGAYVMCAAFVITYIYYFVILRDVGSYLFVYFFELLCIVILFMFASRMLRKRVLAVLITSRAIASQSIVNSRVATGASAEAHKLEQFVQQVTSLSRKVITLSSLTMVLQAVSTLVSWDATVISFYINRIAIGLNQHILLCFLLDNGTQSRKITAATTNTKSEVMSTDVGTLGDSDIVMLNVTRKG